MEFATDSEIDKSGGNLVPKPDEPTKPSVYFDTQTNQNELVSVADYNKEPERYGPKKPDTSNKLKEVFSTADNKNVLELNPKYYRMLKRAPDYLNQKEQKQKLKSLQFLLLAVISQVLQKRLLKEQKDSETLNRFDNLCPLSCLSQDLILQLLGKKADILFLKILWCLVLHCRQLSKYRPSTHNSLIMAVNWRDQSYRCRIAGNCRRNYRLF